MKVTPAQLAAERKVAELHGKLHSYESRISQLTEEIGKYRDSGAMILTQVSTWASK